MYLASMDFWDQNTVLGSRDGEHCSRLTSFDYQLFVSEHRAHSLSSFQLVSRLQIRSTDCHQLQSLAILREYRYSNAQWPYLLMHASSKMPACQPRNFHELLSVGKMNLSIWSFDFVGPSVRYAEFKGHLILILHGFSFSFYRAHLIYQRIQIRSVVGV